MTELDRLLVRIEADIKPLQTALSRIGEEAKVAGESVALGLGTATERGFGDLGRQLASTERATRAASGSLGTALDLSATSALELADAVGRVLGQALEGSIDGWEGLRRVALSVLEDILGSLGQARGGDGGGIVGGLIGALGSAFGISGLRVPGLSAGGRVKPGGLYEVGEGGRELFVPSVPGTVLPSLASDRLLARAGRGGGPTVQISNSYSIDARGAQEGVGGEIVAALDARSARIKAEAVDQVFALMDRGGRYAQASGRR